MAVGVNRVFGFHNDVNLDVEFLTQPSSTFFHHREKVATVTLEKPFLREGYIGSISIENEVPNVNLTVPLQEEESNLFLAADPVVIIDLVAIFA